ncbi:MAG: rod shape-determining protein [Myxococcales bacterium]|nr:rod shape-determining protein [Myxococcales bacterium]
MAATTADLAVDLGTSRTRVVGKGAQPMLLDVPTVVATASRGRKQEVVAVGEDARKMIGRTPEGTRVLRPVRGGVVADFEATEQLLRALLKQVGGRSLRKPRLLVCIPYGTTEVERRAVADSAKAAGAGSVLLAVSPIAAALGADLPVQDPVASMIVDLGGGRTHTAVTSLGGLVVARSAQVAGDDLDEAIGAWLEANRGLQIGERTCETLKTRVGTLIPELHHDLQMRVRGRDLSTGRPAELEVTSDDVAAAIGDTALRIRQLVLDTLAATPPELAADIVDRGMILCGGTSDLRGLDARLRDDTALPVLRAEDPVTCVARGAARLLADTTLLERVATTA